ncbi:MAG: glutaminyl-peptide cyclotransferase, partial [Algibacter sp.]
MNTFKYLTIIFLGGFLISCGSNSGQKKSDFSIITNAEKGNIANNETLNLSLENKKGHTIDSVLYRLEGNKINENTPLKNFKLGKQTIEAIVYFDGEKQSTLSTVTILNSELPKVYTYN